MSKRNHNQSLLGTLTYIFLFLTFCQSYIPKSKTTLFDSCMETFKDEGKCLQFLSMVDPSLPPTQKSLDSAQDQNIYIRNELKDLLDTKSKSYVIEKLGEPEEKYTDGSGREFYKYIRPISRYSKNHDPDIEIIIIFRRNFVTKIVHKKSNTTP
jgi:hypothetical protein